jgi:hypothetical protein
MVMPLRSGVHAELEAAANEMLRISLKEVTRHADKSDILTPWKEQSRRSREVYVVDGTPDGSVRRGIFTRGWNSEAPHLNSVEGFPLPKGAVTGPRSDWDSE